MWRMGRVELQEVAERPDGGDVVHRKGFVVDADAADDVLDHARDLVVHDELRAVEGDTRFDHPRTIDQVGACQRCRKAGEGLLVTGLCVTELGVCLQPGDEARDHVAPRHLRHRGADAARSPASRRRPPRA